MNLPHNHAAERSVLAAILLDPGVLDEVSDLIAVEDIHHPGHRAVYGAMLALADRRDPIDPLTLERRLMATDELPIVGGLEGLGRILDAWGSVQQARHHARLVATQAAKRRIVLLARQIAEEGCEEHENTSEWIASAEERFLVAARRTKEKGYEPIHGNVGPVIKEMIGQATEARDAKHDGRPIPVTGIRTRYQVLDRMTGGLQPSDLVILAARPSMGKTALAVNIATNAAKDGVPVLIISMEMSTPQLIRRMACTESMVDAMRMRDGDLAPSDVPSLVQAGDRIMRLPIAIDERAAQSITAIRSAARRWRRDPRFFPRGERGPGLIMIDYLQLGHGEDGTRTDSRNLEVGQISAGCKAMAKELHLPVLALSQLNRGVDSRPDHRPRLADLRDSGTLEQDADVIGFLYRQERYEEDEAKKANCRRDAELVLGKQRNGPVGTIHLTWLAEHTLFTDPENHDPRD